MVTPDEVADRLAAAGVDPTPSVTRMITIARLAGVRVRVSTLKRGCVLHKRRCGLLVDDRQPPQTCRRRDAAALLDVSVKRVDQLRADGRLTSEQHPHTGRVWITLASVRAQRRARGLDRLVGRESVAGG